ncbi:hypothetical protein [Terrisporobacter petrolearius]|uniref:hypothetical protein n=1 Tax=Terrisporobacter petrolearius TaxID=1460447 RepID=UPI0031CC4D1B
MSKKYYDLPNLQLVCEVDCEKVGAREVKKLLGNDIREISKSEFKRLGELYTSIDKEV